MSLSRNTVKKYIPESILSLYRKFGGKTKLQHYLLDNYGIRYTPKLPDFPPMIMIDTTTRCNLACNHCPSSALSKDKTWVGDMDIDLFKKVIDEVARENPAAIVRPFNSGEPLMRKDMEDLVAYAKQKGIQYVSLNTNGTLLTKKRAESMLTSGLNHIEFSVDAFSKETFVKIKNIDLYDKIVSNIENMIDLKKKIAPNFEISVSFVKQRDNFHEADAFYRYWKYKVNQVTIREYHQHGNLVDDHGKYQIITTKNRWPCAYLWGRVIIQHNGRVRFCESDWKAEHAVGDIKKNSLKEIWHSKAYNELRKSHINGTFDHPYCKKCSDWVLIGRAQ